jgi:threonine dehydratase
MNFDRLRFVAERAEFGEQREAVFAVTLPEKPGAYKKFLGLDRPSATSPNSIIATTPRSDAHVFVGVQVVDRKESLKLVEQPAEAWLPNT